MSRDKNGSHSQFALLGTRRFLPMFLTQKLGAFNDNFFKNALVILVTFTGLQSSSMSSETFVSLAAGLFILPFFVFSAFAGQLADKFDKALMIRRVKLAEIALMLCAGLGFVLESPMFLLAVLFLMGTQSAFFGPLKYGILPDLLEDDELIGGNALIEAATFVAILIGTIAGGLLITTAGGKITISIGLVVVAVAGYLTSRYIPKTGPGDANLTLDPNILRETCKIIGLTWQDKPIFRAIIGISWFWFIGAAFLILFPIYARDVLGANEQVVTLFLALFSIGIAIGSLLCNLLTKGKVSDVLVPFGAIGLSLAGIDLYFASATQAFPMAGELIGYRAFLAEPAGWRILADLLVLSIAGGLYAVPLYAIIQVRGKDAEMARLIAANNILNSLAMVIASALILVMLSLAQEIRAIFITIALLNIPVTLYIMHVVRKGAAHRRDRQQDSSP